MTTNVDTTTTPTAESLRRRAEGLVDQLWAHAADADRNRRVHEDDVAAMRDAGLFGLFVPSRFGGHAAGLGTLYDVSSTLGRGCTSAAWLSGVLNTGCWMAAQFDERAQQEVWGANPKATVAGAQSTDSTATAVDGGRRVSGRWPYSSGALHCDWAVVGLPGADPSRSPVDIALIDMGELTVDDTWYVTGMRATASHTIVADDVFVPDHRILPFGAFGGPDAPNARDAVHRVALLGILPISLLGPQIGAGRAALSVVTDKAPKRAIAYTTFANQTESATFQADVAEAASRIEAATLLGARVAEEMDGYARRGEMPPDAVRTRAWLDTATAAAFVREAVDRLVSAHGTSSFAEVNPLQRLWRDTAVASRHAAYHIRVAQQVHGSTLLGLDPRAVSVLV